MAMEESPLMASYRGASAICRTTWKTVRRAVERHNAGGTAPPRRARQRNYASVSELVAERVAILFLSVGKYGFPRTKRLQ